MKEVLFQVEMLTIFTVGSVCGSSESGAVLGDGDSGGSGCTVIGHSGATGTAVGGGDGGVLYIWCIWIVTVND